MSKTLRLTERAVQNLKSSGKDEIYWDSVVSGFGVRAKPTGAKSYIVYFRIGEGRSGKQKKITLGSCSKLKLETARRAARDLVSKVALGIDPTTKKEVPKEPPEKNQITVAELCETWLDDEGKRSRMRGARFGELRDPKNIDLDRGRIKRHINPLIGNKLVVKLTPKDVRKMRDDIADGKTACTVKTKKHGLARVKGGDGTAARTVRILSTILSYAVREEIIDKNPASGAASSPQHFRERFLSQDEIDRLYLSLRDEEHEFGHKHGITIIRLLLLTGCRKSEIEKLKWSELDLQRGFFYFRKSKTGAKVIPMAMEVRNILAHYLRVSDSDYVFPASRTRLSNKEVDQPYVGTPGIWIKVRKRADLHGVRLHDLRHTFASVAADRGLNLPMIGALLGHSQPSTTARYAHLANESLQKASAMVSNALSEKPLEASGGPNPSNKKAADKSNDHKIIAFNGLIRSGNSLG
jgi:integrase